MHTHMRDARGPGDNTVCMRVQRISRRRRRLRLRALGLKEREREKEIRKLALYSRRHKFFSLSSSLLFFSLSLSFSTSLLLWPRVRECVVCVAPFLFPLRRRPLLLA